MFTGMSPHNLKALSGLLVALSFGQTAVNLARGQELGGFGGIARGFLGLNQKQISETAIAQGNIVYGQASEELGGHLQNAFKLGLVAACPLAAVPMALWEAAEIVDEVRRPDSYTAMGRAKDLLIDIPLSIATTAGIAAMAFKGGGTGKLLQRLGTLFAKQKSTLCSFKELAKKGKSALSPEELKTMKRLKSKFKTSSKEFDLLKAESLGNFGKFLDRHVMSHVNMVKQGMKPLSVPVSNSFEAAA